jgi:hypothetical protein
VTDRAPVRSELGARPLTPDVLTFTVPLAGGTYPSVNHLGHSGVSHGKKSPEYHALFRAVRDAAADEIERIGWRPVHGYCDVEIIRVRPTRHRSDAGNIGKVEADSMEPSRAPRFEGDLDGYRHPFCGVFTNDCFVVPHPRIEYDPDGPDRIIVIVRRIFPFVPVADLPTTADVPAASRPRRRRARDAEPESAAARAGAALLNGRPISDDEAQKILERELGDTYKRRRFSR